MTFLTFLFVSENKEDEIGWSCNMNNACSILVRKLDRQKLSKGLDIALSKSKCISEKQSAKLLTGLYYLG